MTELMSFDLKKYLCTGVLDISNLVADLNFFANHHPLYQNLLAKKDIKNVSILTVVDEDFNLKICADYLEPGDMFEPDKQSVVEQLRQAVSEFSDEYADAVNKKMIGADSLSVSTDFKRIFNSLINLKHIESLQVENEFFPIPQIDKTFLRSSQEACEAPLNGVGTIELFDYNERCHLITPEKIGGKKFSRMKVFCSLDLIFELIEARYDNKILYGEYHVEKLNDEYHLKSFKMMVII